MREKITLILSVLLLGILSNIQGQTVTCPPNIGFENGNFTNWKLYSGSCCPIVTNTSNTNPLNNRHVITSGTGVDPYGGFTVVAPFSGVYSMRLGNSNTGSDAERARYYVQVPAGVNNYSLIYRYAVVFEDPGHTPAEQPRFEVRAYDTASGNAVLPCVQYSYIAASNLPGFQRSAVDTTVYYKTWTTASIDLSDYGGKVIAVDFASGDCDLGGHFGYGYVDLTCGLIQTNTLVCNNQPNFTVSAPAGFAKYEWRDSSLTTLFDTNQTATIPTPTSSRKYAVIISPYTGFGCPDTIYTQVTLSSVTATIINNDTTICDGTTLQLSTNASANPAPVTYSWTPSTGLSCTTCANPVITLPVNTKYYVTGKNGDNCTWVDSVQVNASNIITGITKTDMNCFGLNNGSITTAVSNGRAPYAYSWNTTPVQTTSALTNLIPGTYTVIVNDANSCKDTQTVIINGPTAPLDATTSKTDLICYNVNVGTASVAVTGGTAPYTYSWNTTPVKTTAAITNLSARTYIVTTTDARGCTRKDTVIVTQPPVYNAVTTAQNAVSCFGGSNGTALVSASGGTPPYAYSWNTTPVKTTAIASGLSAGTYTATVTDANGCVDQANVTVSQPTQLTASTTKTDVNCFGGNNGTVSVTAGGGTAPYTYSWNTTPVKTTASVTGLTAGTYTATVTDAKGCIVTATAVIGTPAALTTSMAITDVSCNGGSNGTATVTPAGGTSPYTYSWNTTPVKTTAGITGLAIGTYTITVTDSKGCITTANAVITQPAVLTATTSKTDVSCFGGNTGSATAIPSGGTAPYTYSWNTTPVQTGVTATGLTVGTYTVTVTDAKGCVTNASAVITQPTVLATTTSKTDVSCNGGNNGTATALPTGGTSPYTYSWNTTPVQTTVTATGLTAGAYIVTVTDAKGCSTTAGASITQPVVLSATTSKTDVNCNSGSNGTATAIPAGGTSPYTYSWNTTPVQTTVTATGLVAGTYTVTVTDAKGCVTTANATITQPTTLSASTSKTDVSCFGGNNGTSVVTPTGGTTPYTYSWNTTPVKTTASVTGLIAGSYTVTVTDAKGCIATANTTITQPALLSASTSKTDVSCNGGNNGTAVVTPTGGTSAYTYSWNTTPVKTTASVTGLTAGTYTVTVTDALGCTTTANAVITQPTVLTATTSKTDVSCNGGSNGTATAIPTGGTTSYTYSWNTTPAQTTIIATGLIAGTYTVTVTDAKGCSTTANATITQPATLSATTTKTDVSCFGGSNGTATAVPIGGTTPYSYSWNTTPVQTTVIANNLIAGTYTVTVTDAKGCVTTANATITQPVVLAATTAKTDVSCFGGNNGTAVVTPTGGTTPYTYSWNTTPVKTTASVAGLTAGTYTVTVTDSKGCTTTATAIITQPTLLSASTSKTNVSCNGGNNGTATVTPTGGTTPYTYSWNTSPVQTTAAATGLIAGTYTVTVTDALGCTATANATITQPTVLAATTSKTDVSCNGGNNGTATVTPTGGTTPYTYSWNTTPAQTTVTATSLVAGTYTVTVTDAQGCVTTANATITQPAILTASTTKVDASCNAGNNGTATAMPAGGTTPYTYSWNTTPVQTTVTATGLASGTYTVTVTDAKGCTTTATAIIGAPNALAATTSKTDVSCFGGNNGTATALPTGGTTPYTYSWITTPVKTTATVTGLTAGTYTVTVMDAMGCITSANAVIAQPTLLTASTAKTDVSCFNGSNGTATVTPSGGTAPYTYSWNTTPVKTTANVTGLTAGTYTVTVTDALGCTTTANAVITQPTVLAATTSKTEVSCNSGNNGTATAIPTGGTTPYTYSWSTTPVQTTVTATSLTAGTYTVTVTDAQGCITTANATITQPAVLTASTTKVDASCNAGNNGTATAIPAGGTAPYTYSWNTTPAQTTITATGLVPGIYIVTVTDAKGCITTATATIGSPNALAVSTSKTDVSCFGGNNGTALATVTGGTTPYTYSWNTTPVKTTASITGLIAGTYTVTVTDAQGCITSAPSVITQPTLLTASTSKTDVSCNGGGNGTATLVPAGGTAPYTYSWNTTPVQTTVTATGLTAGTYTVTVTDAKGCVTTVNATVGQPTALAATTSKTDVSCNGGNNGTATAIPTGGTSPYTYSWNTTPAQTTITATGLVAGTYIVTVTDAQGCITTANAAITQPATLTASTTKVDASCNAGNNGTATVIPAGGTAPYIYSWNTTPAQTTVTATGLVPGTYTVTVTDIKGCITTATATIGSPNALAVSTSKTDVSCFGGSNGTALATVTGGTAPFTYSWNTTPVKTTASVTGLIAGTYTVTVTDAQGCITSAPAVVAQPTLLTATTSKTDVSCNSGGNGTATAVPAGGTAPYTYSWNTTPVQTTVTATGLAAGTYTVTVTDAKGCVTTVNAIVGQPTVLAATTSKTDVSCNGGSNGTATAIPVGGTSPYTYSWNTTPAQTTITATGLITGTYTVTVTDAKGCSTTANTTITQPATLTATTTKTDVSCFGGSNGTATAVPAGGTSPYSYSWNTTPVQTSVIVNNLVAGTYTVTVTDAKGCITTANATITQPTVLAASTAKTDVSCFGGNNGTSVVTPAGGTAPYTYSWTTTPVKTTASVTGLTAGSYTVTVTDAKGCITTASAVINQPTLLTATTSKTNVSCFGGNDGTATAIPVGGTSPYTYSWNTTPVQTTVTATTLSIGAYTVTVTDALGCTTTANATITQPTLLTATTTKTDVSCNSGNDGTATAIPAGGTAPYAYSWNTTPAQTTLTATGLTAGAYTVTVTDAKGCITTANATVTEPTLLTATTTKVDASCSSGSNGTATAIPAGGTSPYTYSWNTTPAQTTITATGLASGAYTVTVTDNKGCITTATATIGSPNALAASTTQTNVSCFGGSNGTATVTASGGTSPYSYSWNTTPVKTTTTVTGLTAGTYTVTVTDSKGCNISTSATITQPTVLGATTTKTDVSCYGGNNGTAFAIPTGGTAPYTYSWNTTPVKTTDTITGLTAKTYIATVTDSKGCVTTASAIVGQPPILNAITTAQTPVSCFGGSNGTANVTATGGTAPYTFSWNTVPVKTTQNVSGLAAGTYTATVTDAHGCVDSGYAIVVQPTLLTATTAKTDVSCFGGNSGSATVTPAGGTPPYTYIWNTTPIQTTATANNLAAGTYTVTVTDGKGCVTIASATIGQPTALTATTAKTDVSCFGGNNGTATVSPAGGISPYTYSWNTTPLQTTLTATSLIAGTYTVTVRDAKNCLVTANAIVGQPALLVANASKTDVKCNGGSDGTATAAPTGGIAPYSYSWNTTPVQTTSTITGLPVGSYTVTVTDANNCITTSTVTIGQPPVLAATATKNDVSCFNGSDGTAAALPTGGTTPYSYSWNTTPVQTSAIATNLIAGTYTVTVTDAHGCVTAASTIVTQPALLTVSTVKTDVSCFGGTNGTATALPVGGTLPYSYNWNTTPAQTAMTATSLSAGTYTVIVTDGKGCNAMANATVTEPTQLTASPSKTDVSCFGGNNGTAAVVPVGGTAPYSYNWNTSPAKTTSNVSGLTAGNYTVTITDALGCLINVGITINQPTLLVATTSKTNVSCYGGNDGIASVAVTGGVTPYLYSWNTTPAQTTDIANSLVAGTYTVTVTDSNGCLATATAVITEPVLLTASASKTDVSCYGGSNGTANANPSGGTAPYAYSWNTTPVQTSQTATGLTIGTYTVTVTDAHGCVTTASTTLTEPPLLQTAHIKSDVSCFGGSNGAAAVNAFGGTASYSYSWNTTPVKTTSIVSGLTAGTYVATVTDAHGCITLDTVVITQPLQLVATAKNGSVSCFGGSNGTAWVDVSDGTAPYTYSWNTNPAKTTDSIFGLLAGNYTVTVTDFKGCVTTSSTTITQPTLLTTATSKTDVKCFGGSDGTTTALPAGGTPPYTYSWNTSPIQTTVTATGLPIGTYTVTVTDSNGCIATSAITVNEPTLLIAPITKTDVSCYGGNNGTATVNAAGGMTPYTYSWSTTPVQTTPTASGLIAGVYTVQVKDSNNCVATNIIVINQPTQLNAGTSKTNVSCYGGNNGTATVFATGGTPPYSYSWNTIPVKTTASVSGLTAGTYVVTVTDAKNCVVTATVYITQPGQLAASFNKKNVSCFGGNNGAATVVPAGGTPPYTYSWNVTPAVTTANISGLTAGTYTVTVTDALGCVINPTVTITEPQPLTHSMIKSDARCFGESNGTATVTMAGGTPPYSYTWYPAGTQTTSTAIGLPKGSYYVKVKDANGCEDTAQVSIDEPALLVAATTVTDVSCYDGSDGTATVTATGGTLPYSASWKTNPVQTTTTATGLMAGKYTVVLTDAHGCADTVTTDSIRQPEPIVITTVNDRKACVGIAEGVASADASGGIAPYAYLWNSVPSQSGPKATSLYPGIYTVTVTDGHGCTKSQEVMVEAYPVPEMVVSNDTSICLGAMVDLHASGVQFYKWSPTLGLSCSNCPSPVAGPIWTTVYTVIGVDTNKCRDTAHVELAIMQREKVSVDATVDVCIGDPAQLNVYGGESYTWLPNEELNNNTLHNPISYTDTSKEYMVIIKENECFTDTLYQNVMVHPRPTVNLGPDLRGMPGGMVQLKAETTNSKRIRWVPETDLSCIDCDSPTAFLNKTITYTAIVNSGICEASDDITIRVSCDDNLVWFPNTFSPNGDGNNDVFWPMAQGVATIDKLLIFNRLGEMVFDQYNFPANDPNYGWDGKYKLAPLPPDVYIYFLERKCGESGQRIFVKGDVSIVY